MSHDQARLDGLEAAVIALANALLAHKPNEDPLRVEFKTWWAVALKGLETSNPQAKAYLEQLAMERFGEVDAGEWGKEE